MSTDQDGYQLSEYEKMRLERIAKNEKYLESLGLSSTKQKLKDMTKKTKKNRQKLLPKVEPGQERRSRRISNNNSKQEYSLVMLSYNEEDRSEMIVKQEEDYDFERDTEDDDSVGARTSSSRSRSRRCYVNRNDWEITDEEKKVLEKDIDDNYLAKFKEFLVFHNKISEQNVRNVMKQVRKLATGQGIRYESKNYGWPENCYFMKGTVVTPLSDIVDLMEKGQECEHKWGRDHGNGWLLSHPLKKLLLFQQFVLNNPDFLAAKCKLKEYYDMNDDDNDNNNDVKVPDDCRSTHVVSPDATPENSPEKNDSRKRKVAKETPAKTVRKSRKRKTRSS